MPGQHNFEYLPLLRRYKGRAKIRGFGTPSPQTVANRQAVQAHVSALRMSAQSLSTTWQIRQAQRQNQNLPVIPEGIPVLLKVDPSLDLDVLRDKFAFEIVAEQEDGYVIVASRDIQLGPFLQMVDGFSVQVRGSATVASVHTLFDDPDQMARLHRILSERLFNDWPMINEAQLYVVDIGISCAGTREIPPQPKRGKTETDANWARRENTWSKARADAYTAWDDIKASREDEITQIAGFYQAEILSLADGGAFTAILPDSFTIRLRIIGKGLKDFVLNYPYIFEVVEPEDIELPQRAVAVGAPPGGAVTPTHPDINAPAVCVIDSGIQEAHVLLQPAIDQATSYCFVPGKETNDVGDFVQPAGHGTRVAGAVLYGEEVAKEGSPQLPFWIQNARVLDENNRMPVALFPPAAVRAAVERFHHGPRKTRIFNHSINAQGYCRMRYMSSWAAEIDVLCNAYDVLVVQSAGNIAVVSGSPYLGMKDHLEAGRDYPDYLYEASCRVANPGQSLQALTVGSVAYGPCEARRGRASQKNQKVHRRSLGRDLAYGMSSSPKSSNMVVTPSVQQTHRPTSRLAAESLRLARSWFARRCSHRGHHLIAMKGVLHSQPPK